MKRVAVTGWGVVTPLGNTAAELLDSLQGGRSGICRIESADYPHLASPIAAPCRFQGSDFFPAPRLRMLDRATQFALAATQAALADAQLAVCNMDSGRTGVFLGTGMGGSPTTDQAYRHLYANAADRLPPMTVLMAMNHAPCAWIAVDYSLSGPSLTFSTACSSSTVAIGEAARRIQYGEADIMIAGGTESPLSPGPMMAWDALRTLAMEDPADPAASCKPFARDRSGMVLAEGAAIVILEAWEHAKARGAPIRAELVGYGLSTDSGHLTRPAAEGQALAMRKALDASGLPIEAIGYLNAHGTGTAANDAAETRAIRQVFGPAANQLPVSSTKSMHGHLLGAAGALEFIVALLAMQERFLPPTMHLLHPDPECDLDYVPNASRQAGPIDAVMSNSFAFGGTNAVLIARSA